MVEAGIKVNEVADNGFTIFNGMFSSMEAEAARLELMQWFEKDLEERAHHSVSEAHFDGVAGHTILTKPSHLMIDVYGKSPTLDKMVDKILTDPLTSTVLKEMVGSHVDFYGYNIRLMTGSYDPAPAHEFHRDSPGEMGIGILLTDIPTENDAATAIVPGSHYYPYCPRWNTSFVNSSANYHSFTKMKKRIMSRLPFNRLLERKINKIATGVRGNQGDAYFFTNDVWHGREPNLNGKKTMVLLIACSSPDLKLHHPQPSLPETVISSLPESIRKAFCDRNKPLCPEERSLIRTMLATRKKLSIASLFFWAKLERQLMDKIDKGQFKEIMISLPLQKLKKILSF